MSKLSALFLIASLTLVTSPAWGLSVYNDQATFDTAHPGLTTEDFEANNMGVASSKVCPSPLNNSSDNTCFNSGDLKAGAEYGLPDNPSGTQLALQAPVDTLTTRIGANSASDFVVIRFPDLSTTEAGLELICTFSPRAGTVRFYSANGLITEQAVACSATGDFIAISSETAIVRIEAEAAGTFEFIDNFSFGKSTQFTAYTDRTIFETTFPTLNKEDFESNNLGGAGAIGCPSPLDTNSDNGCFSPGDLTAGVQYSVQANPLIPQLSLSGPLGSRTTSIGANGFSDYLIASFSDPLTKAVGLGLYCFVNPGPASVRFYNEDELITEQIIDCGYTLTFIGIAANKHITRIETEQTDENEFMDNLLFGRAVMELTFEDGFE